MGDVILCICENMVDKNGGVTSYPSWTVYQLLKTIY